MTTSLVFSITTTIAFAIYLQTLSDSIAGGDAGELVAEGCVLGTAHPPGYPLYTVIVYLVTSFGKIFLPVYTPAKMVNATSSLFGSIASGLVSATIYEITADHRTKNENNKLIVCPAVSASAAAGLMFAFSPLCWQYNTSAEVFALNNLFVAAIAFVLTKYNQTPSSSKTVVIGAYLCGLSLTNQHTTILLVVPVAVWVLFSSTTIRSKKMIMLVLSAFSSGLSAYILLPIFASLYPHAGSWGSVTSVRGFIHHFLRKDYGTLQLWSGGGGGTTEDMITRTFLWITDFSMQQVCHPAIMLFFILGCKSLSLPSKTNKRRKKMLPPGILSGRVIIVSLVSYLAIFHSLSNLPLSNPLLFGVHQRFWMHPNVLCFVLIGVGLDTAARSLVARSRTLSSRISARVLQVMMVFIPLMTFCGNLEASDQSQNNVFRGYASSILESLPQKSLLLINYDMTFTSVRYMQECEGFRDDVETINLSMMTYPWYSEKQHLHEGVNFPGSHYTRENWINGGFTFGEFISANSGRDVFIAGRLVYDDPTYVHAFEEQPKGLVRQIITRRSHAIEEATELYRNSSFHAWKTVSKHLPPGNLPLETKYPATTWEWTVKREFVDNLVSRSTYLLDIALKCPPTDTLHSITEAAAWLEFASSLDESLNKSPSMKKNLGLAYMNMVRSFEEEFPILDDIFGVKTKGTEYSWVDQKGEWKAWATKRWQRSWEQFLEIDSAREEADYHSVKQIYDSVMKSSRARSDRS